jgi:hypothetical protein
MAAGGLVIIMIGATAVTFRAGVSALFPGAVGCLAALVVYGRVRIAPLADRQVAGAAQRSVADAAA